MPPADDAPRRLPRRRFEGRGRVILITAAVVLVVLITSLRGIASFWTDYLWFDSLGQGGVFTGRLKAQATLVAMFTGTFFVLQFTNLLIADRVAPAFRPPGPEEEVVERYRELVGARVGLVRVAVAAVFALVVGAGTSGQWQSWVLFRNAVDFGETDPLFHRDVGFYVFQLPFLSFAVGWLFAALVIVLMLTTVAHYLNGGIRLQVPGPERVTPQVKVHLSVILGLLAVVRAGDYYLERFELTVSTRGTVDGATYTDVNVQLPATNLLILIALSAAVLFLLNTRRKGWALPAMAIGIWAVVAVVGGAILPTLIQTYGVKPSESSREREFIVRNIEATREAIGLGAVTEAPFVPSFQLGADDLAGDNEQVIDNIRLWDPAADAAGATYQSLQSIRNFYAINDVDIDRYEIDGELTQVIVSARDLRTSGVPESWESRHLAFTHGYGLVVAPTNLKDEDGRPSFLVSDIPLDEEGPAALHVEQPGIYFGENLSGFVVTNTERRELDFQDSDNQQVFTEYDGADGVNIGSSLRRAAFALRFADPNLLFSRNLDGGSRVLFERDIRQRAQTLAPFLDFDSDPYPVVLDGRIQWVLDAYTTSSRYPYAQAAITDGLEDSDLDERFNYVRNSVKVVIDAYDGTSTFYVIDPEDPIINAYAQAFPDLFTFDAPPPELVEHFRYPEDMFRVQSNMWGRYHLSDPDVFYTQAEGWVVARDPGRSRQATAGTNDATTDTTAAPNAPPRQQNRIDPYYVLTRLPGQEELSFQLLRPFVPFSPEDDRQQLTAYLVAESDGAGYGRLTSYNVTGGNLPDGPGIVADSISGAAEVSEQQSLLCRSGSGSKCTFGNLILVPIEDSLLYVQPLYVLADRADAPALLERVIVEYDGDVAIGSTLREALQGLPNFTDLPDDPGEIVPSDPEDDPEPGDEEIDDRTIAQLLVDADALIAEANDLPASDLGHYAELIAEAQDLIQQAQDLLEEQTGEEPPPATVADATTTTSTTEPQSA
jgi:uncharacterized membrane protein (UPF0182 family)